MKPLLVAGALLGLLAGCGPIIASQLALDIPFRGYTQVAETFRTRRALVLETFTHGGLDGLSRLGASFVCVDTASAGPTFPQAEPHTAPTQDGRLALYLEHSDGRSEAFYAHSSPSTRAIARREIGSPEGSTCRTVGTKTDR